MNGAPGGSRQSEKLPIQPPTTTAPVTEVGTIRPATLRALQSTAAAIFPQQEEAGPSSQAGLTIQAPQVYALGAGLVQQTAGLRETPSTAFPLHTPAAQQPSSWPQQFDIQQLQSAQAAGLRYSQTSATCQQPSPAAEVTLAPPSALSSQMHTSATPSASLLTGIGLGPGSSSLSPSAQTPSLQMLGALNPAFLTQYQLIIAAAAHQAQQQQQQAQAAAAAAALAATPAGHSAQLGSRMGGAASAGGSSSAGVSLEQNLQRYLLQLQQQQQLASASHLLPSSPLPSTSFLAALAAVGALQAPQPVQPARTNATPPSHARMAMAVAQAGLPSPGAEGSIRTVTGGTEFLHPLPTRVPARHTAPTHPGIVSGPSTSAQQPQAQSRSILMPPPSLPRARHSLTQERRRHAPYPRPTPVIAASTTASAAGTSSAETAFQMGTLPSHPYYPSHFMRGTVIRLQSGQLKRVEDMSTEDFVLSAAMKSDLIICNSTVVRIQEVEKDRQVLVTFAVGEQRIQVTIEAGIEHPYFVVGRGWASCSPERTRVFYGLQCRQLTVGDVCITLRHSETSGPSTSGQHQQRPTPGPSSSGRHGTAASSSTPGTSGTLPASTQSGFSGSGSGFHGPTTSAARHRSAGSRRMLQRAPPIASVGTAAVTQRKLLPPTCRSERISGTKSAPPHEISRKTLPLLNIHGRTERQRRNSTLS